MPRTNAALRLGFSLALAACDSARPTDPTNPGLSEAPGTGPQSLSDTWATKRSLSPARSWMAAGAINGVIYVVGGERNDNGSVLARVDGYTVGTNTWSQMASLPSPRVAPNGASVIEGKLYVTGGRDRYNRPTRTLFVFDPRTNSWTRKSDMPRAGHHGVQGVIDGKLYVYMPAAGDDPCPIFLRYNPATNVWVRRAPPPAEHSRGAGGVVNGTFLLAGGWTRDCHAGEEHWDRHERLDAYDPVRNSWTSKAPMSSAREEMAGVVLNGRLHLMGGRGDGEIPVDQPTLEVYSVTTNRWTMKAPMPAGHIAGAAAAASGRIFYISGLGGDTPSEVYAYTP